jgi:hypothetical protein
VDDLDLEDPEILAEFARIVTPDGENDSPSGFGWVLPLVRKDEVLAFLRRIPSGGGTKALDSAARQLLTERGFTPPDAPPAIGATGA